MYQTFLLNEMVNSEALNLFLWFLNVLLFHFISLLNELYLILHAFIMTHSSFSFTIDSIFAQVDCSVGYASLFFVSLQIVLNYWNKGYIKIYITDIFLGWHETEEPPPQPVNTMDLSYKNMEKIPSIDGGKTIDTKFILVLFKDTLNSSIESKLKHINWK